LADQLRTIPQVMERLQLGRTSVYTLIRSGQLASVRIGRARRVPEAALEAFIAARQAEEASRGAA
jgi:excisionase family DNA binding protein